MRFFSWIIAVVLFLIGIQPIAAASGSKSAKVDKKVAEILARMTLEEKIGQTVQVVDVNETTRGWLKQSRIGSFLSITDLAQINELQKMALENSRLKIPLIFGFDVIHGFKTIFPIPLAESASWDPSGAEKTARVAAKETRAHGIHWTFAPMVDIARDPRWGRIAEGSGEDPFLGSILAAARVRGFQGTSLSAPDSLVACAKHYAAYGAAEAGRDYNSVDLSERMLREVYLPPFHAAVDAGVGTFMSSFNTLNRIPATASHFLQTQVLRDEWKFDGFVVSDWNSIGELLLHGVAASEAEAAEKAVKAGVDMDMVGNIYVKELTRLVKEGIVPQRTVDEAVRRILRIKVQLGLFENPYADPSRANAVTLTKENLEAARESAQKAMVLLKNEKNLLPLSKNLKSLAVIGPLAADRNAPLGSWSGKGSPENVVTILEGIQAKLPGNAEILHVAGCDIEGKDASPASITQAVEAARKAGMALLVVGESAEMSGEAGSRASLDLPGHQKELVKAVVETGVPTVMVLMNGRPLTISWEAQHVTAILEAWQLGVQMGNAVADVLFGDYNPGGKLPATFPRALGQVPLYYNHLHTGRPPSLTVRFTSRYLDLPHTPLYPFGYGLSYTTFQLSNLQLSASKIGPNGSLKVTAELENTGKRVGDEVVQLYIQDVVASVSRPVKELKGFQRISLAPDERKKVEFSLGPKELGFYDENMKFVVEPGSFKIWVGASSEDESNGTSFEVTKP